MASIAETLRQALLAAPSRYRVAQETGVQESTLSRFLSGQSDLRVATADVLAEYFELELRPKAKPKRKT